MATGAVATQTAVVSIAVTATALTIERFLWRVATRAIEIVMTAAQRVANVTVVETDRGAKASPSAGLVARFTGVHTRGRRPRGPYEALLTRPAQAIDEANVLALVTIGARMPTQAIQDNIVAAHWRDLKMTGPTLGLDVLSGERIIGLSVVVELADAEALLGVAPATCTNLRRPAKLSFVAVAMTRFACRR